MNRKHCVAQRERSALRQHPTAKVRDGKIDRIFSNSEGLGVNYQQLPVNQPRCPVMHYQRDGFMALGNNGGSSPNYEPNSYDNAPKQNPAYAEPPLPLGDVAVSRYDHREGKV